MSSEEDPEKEQLPTQKGELGTKAAGGTDTGTKKPENETTSDEQKQTLPKEAVMTL